MNETVAAAAATQAQPAPSRPPDADAVQSARALPLPAVVSNVIALAAGALLVCAFAPLGLWWLALLCPALLMWLWDGAAPGRAAWTGFYFGVGTFGLGTWWLYVSIHGMGLAPIWLAVALVSALVLIMGAYYALLGYLCARLLPAHGAARYLLGLPGLWLLLEWWRGWFLSGFPWLSLGYSQSDTYCVALPRCSACMESSALLLLGSGALVGHAGAWSNRLRLCAAVLLILPWPLGALLDRHQWTHVAGAPLSVAVLQGAVPQDLKWQAANLAPTRELYARLMNEALGAQSDRLAGSGRAAAAPTRFRNISARSTRAPACGTRTSSWGFCGWMRPPEHYFNSIMTLADDVRFYDKHHLVPFAEYFPVPGFIRSWLRLMDLPYSDFTPGAPNQPPISAAGVKLAPSICYEDAYGSSDLTALAAGATLLVNVTNDAWFGHTWARYQHLQISRLRAQEAARPLIRAASDGVSVLMGPKGQILAEAPEFKATVLRGTVQPLAGLTPYVRFGNTAIVGLGLLAAGLAVAVRLSKF